MTDWRAIGRGEKVAKMVATIDAQARASGFDPFGDAETIARFLRTLDGPAWHGIQCATGNRRKEPPSKETTDAVVETYEKRVDLEREAS
jgi:hypothetical protein